MRHLPCSNGTRYGRWLVPVASLVLLAACASGPSDTLSLVPAELDAQTSTQGWFAQPVRYVRQPAGCGAAQECAKLTVDSLTFPGHPRLGTLIDHALATMTWLDDDEPAPYATIEEFESYYLRTAASRDQVELIARPRYRNAHLTVVELTSGQYRTGMAHGIQGTQFINWDNDNDVALVLDDLLQPGAQGAFQDVLRQAHAQWLKENASNIDSIDDFNRMWPFAPTDNVALTDLGLVVKYQSYEIAPYAWGQPELLIPYSHLRGLLRARYLPPQAGQSGAS